MCMCFHKTHLRPAYSPLYAQTFRLLGCECNAGAIANDKLK